MMDDDLLELAINEALKQLRIETDMVEKIQSELDSLNAALPIHLELKHKYETMLDNNVTAWQAMQKRRMDREKQMRKDVG